MHEKPDPAGLPRQHAALSDAQRSRLAVVRRTLAASRVINLAALDEAELITLIETLRASLDESVLLLDDLDV
ncbi:hypothetical protein LG634_24515 [Streptomyces bambusae]|uniref:hypothetical protein n=1 Tax=Streptomyces bambusae TaxID=1550616 RepID=UPI001CFCF16E|nr:hypothetical protein [Streptomyces bambusae]MCB5167978.1 hypothetical protein [Streptomyces bambusae]